MASEVHNVHYRGTYTVEVELWGQSHEAIGECLADIKREAIRVSKRKVLDRRYKVCIQSARLV